MAPLTSYEIKHNEHEKEWDPVEKGQIHEVGLMRWKKELMIKSYYFYFGRASPNYLQPDTSELVQVANLIRDRNIFATGGIGEPRPMVCREVASRRRCPRPMIAVCGVVLIKKVVSSSVQ